MVARTGEQPVPGAASPESNGLPQMHIVRRGADRLFVRWRAGHAVGVAQPVEQVAVLAAPAAKRRVRGIGGLAAKRASIGLVGHHREMGREPRARKRLTNGAFGPR